ncbi:MDR/zinc-dependent alcohol dehydrogenase-like family protein [Persicimonas caeni]|nr:zinc-binding dehydrogenase [Persicimonas caeni]
MPTNDTMKVAVLAEPGHFRLEEKPKPEPGPNQVLLELEGCGVCASNIPPFEGREWFDYPFEPGQPGHEGWGVVEAVGESVTDFEPGDRVAALTYNAYATYDLADASACVKLPEELDGVPFPGEPLGCAMNIFRRSDIEEGQTVAIIGVGFLGSLMCALASDAGARVIAISRREISRDFGERFGAWKTIPMEDHQGIIDEVEKLTEGDLCDRVIECVGKQWPLDLAAELTRVRGRLVIAGYHQDGARQVDMQMWNWRGLDVVNAHERDQKMYVQGMRDAVDAVQNGRLDPTPLFTHEFALDEMNEALQAAKERPDGFMKALINTREVRNA